MYLVHEKKEHSGKWEVAWMWLPQFLAMDAKLHKTVDQKMTQEFKGVFLEVGVNPSAEHMVQEMHSLVMRMHNRVIDLILEEYPMPGLRGILEAYTSLEPGERS